MQRAALVVWTLAVATPVLGCQQPPKSKGADAGDEAVEAAEATGDESDGETRADAANSEAPHPDDELLPDDPADLTPPEPAVELAREVVAAMNADDADELQGPIMSKEVYVSDRMTWGLARNKKAVESLGRDFLWNNLHEDSEDDREWIFRTWKGRPVEFVSVRVNAHEDKEEIELWKGTVLRVREKATGRRLDLLILGEFVHDKVDDQWYLLRYAKRRKR